MPLAPGSRLGPYVLHSLIGAGGMGEVYRAEDSRLGRTVAIKVLRPDLATPDRVARFEQEARAASSLNHPNILTIHDVGREGDVAYFATEWVDGQTIRALLTHGPVPLRRAIALAHQVAEGLAKAHAAGIVHRDLKPENVMVTADGLAKIVDFGIAKLTAGTAASAGADEAKAATVTRAETAFGSVLGTAGYMSPEQASGRAVDYRSDQFSLGLLIYELVTRTRPFERASTAQSLAATIDEEPAPIETLRADVPPHLAAVVARCLAKDPAERYESTGDLARDLKSIFGTASQHHAAAPRSRSLSRRAAVIAAAVVLLAAAVGVARWMRSQPAAETAERGRPLIVVRPFTSLSPDPAQGYFAAGITDEIRGQLSQVSSLRLLSRNGLDAYKDDVARAVRELGVGNFVDGSIRVDGNRVRVSAELVDASNQQTLWSNQYDRDLADVLAVQSEIATQIVRSLHTSLSPSEQTLLEKRPTEHLEAYALAVQANQLGMFDRAQNLQAIGMYRKALALDPKYADARSRLAYRLMMMGYTYGDPADIDKGVAEAEAALSIDPLRPNTYFVLGSGYGIQGRYEHSRQAFLRALELDPNNTSAMNNFSVLEGYFGRLDDSAYWGRRSFGLSGKRGNDFYHLIIPLLSLRSDAETRTLLAEAERRFPTFARVQILFSLLELFEGDVDRAVARTTAVVARNPKNEEVRIHGADMAFLADSPDLESHIEPLMEHSASTYLTVAETVRLRYAFVLARRGESAKAAAQVAEAERVARERIDKGNQTPALRIELAAAAVLRKDRGAALEWLERAHQGGYREYAQIERDPILAELRSEPRYRAVVEAMRRDVDAQRARARERGLRDIAGVLTPAR
jgi:serine/threonine protein kinase